MRKNAQAVYISYVAKLVLGSAIRWCFMNVHSAYLLDQVG